MKFKEYPKTYEDYYTSKLVNPGCRYERISVEGEESVEEYIQNLKGEIEKGESQSFDHLIKVVWMFRRFRYNKQKKNLTHSNGKAMNIAFGAFMRKFIGTPFHFTTGNKMNLAIFSYFDDFFPGFDQGNPFKIKYEYPFKFMNFGCLMFVYKMDERMELLKIGEERKMTYIEFVNYVINYALSLNEEFGEIYYLSARMAQIPFPHFRKVQK